MAGPFSAAVSAKLRDATVNIAHLVYFKFKTTPMRLHLGFGDIESAGFTWKGSGDLISVSGLDVPIGGTAQQTVFTMSGVNSTIVAAVMDASDEAKNREVIVYMQVLEITSGGALTLLETPKALWAGRMDQLSITAEGDRRTVEITAENIFIDRARPPWGLLTQRDQDKLRGPGDRAVEHMTRMPNLSIKWPAFSDSS